MTTFWEHLRGDLPTEKDLRDELLRKFRAIATMGASETYLAADREARELIKSLEASTQPWHPCPICGKTSSAITGCASCDCAGRRT